MTLVGVARGAYAYIPKLGVEDVGLIWPELFIQDSKMSAGEPSGPEPPRYVLANRSALVAGACHADLESPATAGAVR
jgi:hypothetical protein